MTKAWNLASAIQTLIIIRLGGAFVDLVNRNAIKHFISKYDAVIDSLENNELWTKNLQSQNGNPWGSEKANTRLKYDSIKKILFTGNLNR